MIEQTVELYSKPLIHRGVRGVVEPLYVEFSCGMAEHKTKWGEYDYDILGDVSTLIEGIEPEIENGKYYGDNNTMSTIGFGIRHPFIALDIGQVKPGKVFRIGENDILENMAVGLMIGANKMKNKVRFIAVSMILIVCITACQIQNEVVLSNFYSTYSNAENLDEFCRDNDSYMLKIEIEETRIQLVLRRTDSNWKGNLSLYENTAMVQSIPVAIVGEELVFYTQTENKVPITVLLFSQFDPLKCTVIQSSADVMGAPELEEVIGEYPIEEIKQYMQKLYDHVLSNLTMFDRKEDYMAAITALDSFTFNRSTANDKKDCYSLTLGFSGNQNLKWDPGFGGFENISMLFSERVPIAWQ